MALRVERGHHCGLLDDGVGLTRWPTFRALVCHKLIEFVATSDRRNGCHMGYCCSMLVRHCCNRSQPTVRIYALIAPLLQARRCRVASTSSNSEPHIPRSNEMCGISRFCVGDAACITRFRFRFRFSSALVHVQLADHIVIVLEEGACVLLLPRLH